MEEDSLSRAPWENRRVPFSVSSKKVTKDAYFLPDNVHFQAAVEADVAPHQTQETSLLFGSLFVCQCLPHFPFTPVALWHKFRSKRPEEKQKQWKHPKQWRTYTWTPKSIACPSGPGSALLLLPQLVAQPQPIFPQGGRPIQAWSLALVASKLCPGLSWAGASQPWLTPAKDITSSENNGCPSPAWGCSVLLVPWPFPSHPHSPCPTCTRFFLPPWPLGQVLTCSWTSSPHTSPLSPFFFPFQHTTCQSDPQAQCSE